MNRMEEVLDDVHLQQTNFFQQRHHSDVGDYLSVKHPVKFSATPASVRNDAPRLGEHNNEILSGLGYSEADISEILGDGKK